jgi:hypothetical protein
MHVHRYDQYALGDVLRSADAPRVFVQVSEDNTAAIADIDARLHALQDFLRAAKATTA